MAERIVALTVKCPSCGRSHGYICQYGYWDGSVPSEGGTFSTFVCTNVECKTKVQISRVEALKNVYSKEFGGA